MTVSYELERGSIDGLVRLSRTNPSIPLTYAKACHAEQSEASHYFYWTLLFYNTKLLKNGM